MSLNPLPSLPSLPSLSQVYNTAQAADQAATSAVQNALMPSVSQSGKYIAIALGFLLVAAGIFSFDKTREIVVQAGKTATKAAAVAA